MRDGCVVLWRCEKNPQPYKSFRPDTDARDLNVTAVDTIIWLPTCLVVSGGMPFSCNDQITVAMGAEFNVCRKLTLPGSVLPLQVIHTPIGDSEDCFLLLTQGGSLLCFKLPEPDLYFLSELYGGTEVLCSRFYTISSEGEGLMELIRNLAPAEIPVLLSGGEIVENPSDVYGLLVTGHVSGVLRFWSVSTVRIRNIVNLSLLAKETGSFYTNTYHDSVSDVGSCKISCAEVFSNKLVVGFDMGKVGIWEIIPQKLALLCVYQYHSVPVLLVSLLSDFIVTGDLDGFITTYNFNTCQASVLDLQRAKPSQQPSQKVSVTSMCVISSLVYIGLSNGTLNILSPASQQFLAPPKLGRRDLKSEVPKKSEVGIVKILQSCVHDSLVVLCYERAMTLCLVQDLEVKQSQCWTCSMVNANVGYIRSEVYIYILHSDGVLSLLDFNSLTRVWKCDTALPGL